MAPEALLIIHKEPFPMLFRSIEFISIMLEIYKNTNKTLAFLNFLNIPRIFVSKSKKTGREYPDISTMNYTKVTCRHGIIFYCFTGRDENGNLRQGIKIVSETTTGKPEFFNFKLN